MEERPISRRAERIAVDAGILIMSIALIATPPLAIYDIFIRDKNSSTEEIEDTETTTTTTNLPETGVTAP